VHHIEDMSAPRTPVIYEVVRRFGEDEMARPATSLWWAGVAAGLSMSFSLLAQTILEQHLRIRRGGRWCRASAIASAF
jgi:formate/nitrite transporter FocA (FNT family)